MEIWLTATDKLVTMFKGASPRKINGEYRSFKPPCFEISLEDLKNKSPRHVHLDEPEEAPKKQ